MTADGLWVCSSVSTWTGYLHGREAGSTVIGQHDSDYKRKLELFRTLVRNTPAHLDKMFFKSDKWNRECSCRTSASSTSVLSQLSVCISKCCCGFDWGPGMWFLTRSTVDAWIQTAKEMLRVQTERAADSSVSKQHHFRKKDNSRYSCFQQGFFLPTSLPGSTRLLIHQGAGGSGSYRSSCCWTRDTIKNAWEQARDLCQKIPASMCGRRAERMSLPQQRSEGGDAAAFLLVLHWFHPVCSRGKYTCTTFTASRCTDVTRCWFPPISHDFIMFTFSINANHANQLTCHDWSQEFLWDHTSPEPPIWTRLVSSPEPSCVRSSHLKYYKPVNVDVENPLMCLIMHKDVYIPTASSPRWKTNNSFCPLVAVVV